MASAQAVDDLESSVDGSSGKCLFLPEEDWKSRAERVFMERLIKE
jgi:hypothetical protein